MYEIIEHMTVRTNDDPSPWSADSFNLVADFVEEFRRLAGKCGKDETDRDPS
jgi:hypothetical protein